jgi:hypothetical protein
MKPFHDLFRAKSMTVGAPMKSASIEAVITTRDGTKIPLGAIAVWHRNPLIRAWSEWRLKRRIAKLRKEHPERFEEHA